MGNDMLSQEEIDLLLKGEGSGESSSDNEMLSDVEKDTLGEIGNISMGTSATTLSTLLNRKVTITTPKVEITDTKKLAEDYSIPFVAVDVKYKEGLEGSNILVMDEIDVKIITDLMMGNEINVDRELTELDLSAISEVMNQMMGSSSTSLSELLSKRIDIEPPTSYNMTFAEGENELEVLQTEGPIIKIFFKMVVEDLIDSNIMQLVPIDFGLEIVQELMGGIGSEDEDDIEESIVDEDNKIYVDSSDSLSDISSGSNIKDNSQLNETNKISQENVVIKKPQFETFEDGTPSQRDTTVDLVGDIPVEITAELGRTTKKIGEILDFGQGTVIELDKLVGEPLNIYANGKFIAKGEVVVIDDNFGIRITSIENKYYE